MNDRRVGIVSYGAYIPSLVLASSEIARAQQGVDHGLTLGVKQKTIPNQDEDTATMAVMAAVQARDRLPNHYALADKGALFVGSESHPYAVKPTGTIVHQALGLSPQCALADFQFACKAGTAALQAGLAYVRSGMSDYGLAIGADTAQSRPGDVLEFTAASGAAAFFLGSRQLVTRLVATTSYVSDTPDFWRRPHQPYPEHAGRFTGEPAYFHHVLGATQQLLRQTQTKISDYTYCIFHTPNGKFPILTAKKLGCTEEQMRYSLVVKNIGNTYAAASLLALVNVLDHAQSGETILLTSYGSGAGADSFAFECTSYLSTFRRRWRDLLPQQIERCQPTTYDTYRQNTL